MINFVLLQQKPRREHQPPRPVGIPVCVYVRRLKCPFATSKLLLLIYFYRKNSYTPSTHVCCSGSVFRKPSQCCGSKSYYPSYQVCCGGNVFRKPCQCCGSKPYYPSYQVFYLHYTGNFRYNLHLK